MRHPSQSSQQDQFVLRLPDGMRDRIAAVARDNNRSMNGEIVSILEKYFQPSLTDRLKFIIDQQNNNNHKINITPSKIAEFIGESNAEAVEAAFSGKVRLTFNQLDQIATYFGLRPEWLKHGDGAPYPVEYGRFTAADAYNLMNTNFNRLIFLRSKGEAGELAIVTEYENFKFNILSTPINVSLYIGNSGRKDNANLSNACRLLFKSGNCKVTSYLIEHENYLSLVDGNTLPSLIMKDLRPSFWVDEWWDESNLDQNYPDKFWNNYYEFCLEISKYIDQYEFLKSQKEEIQAGVWRP